VSVFNNLIKQNVANDDGGGLRFLMAGNAPISVFNNMIVNNVSTHEGGGVAFDDTTNTRFYNNTVMKNITTATAATSNGVPAPAGLSDTKNSDLRQASLPAGHLPFSDPLMFNNIFYDNRAGAFNLSSGTVGGIGLDGDPDPINHWDMGVADGTGVLHPHHSLLQVLAPDNSAGSGAADDGTNLIGVDPAVIDAYDTGLLILPWRGDPHFAAAITIAHSLAELMVSNYHLAAGSPAIDIAANTVGGVNAPAFDIDNETRPNGAGKDLGADER
jgi:hypothetical protein